MNNNNKWQRRMLKPRWLSGVALVSSALIAAPASAFAVSDSSGSTKKQAPKIIETQFKEMSDEDFYQSVMIAPALTPQDKNQTLLQGLTPLTDDESFISASQINYQQENWQERALAEQNALSLSIGNAKVLVIELGQHQHQQQLRYRYRSNLTESELFEPWSSSKVMAITGAMVKANQNALHGDFLLGKVHFSDVITSIHSYQPSGLADGNSNALASYLVNVVGREQLSRWFHQDWLNVQPENIALRGAYAAEIFSPQPARWSTRTKNIEMPVIEKNNQDPFYLSYRCSDCGITGNKPMTTLALAEWLKRLVVNELEPSTALNTLNGYDLSMLFYGGKNLGGEVKGKDNNYGMSAGVSRLLPLAIAHNIAPNMASNMVLLADEGKTVTRILDAATQGQWRVFQKVGWGYSGTRTAGEMVYLAHVSLPHFQGGKEFTIAAQVAVPGDDEALLYQAGRNMFTVLSETISQVLMQDEER